MEKKSLLKKSVPPHILEIVTRYRQLSSVVNDDKTMLDRLNKTGASLTERVVGNSARCSEIYGIVSRAGFTDLLKEPERKPSIPQKVDLKKFETPPIKK